MLYPLYILSEAAIVATDLAEVLGSGIALCLLFPSLPLWGGVLLTSADVFILLLIGDPLKGRPVRVFEVFVGAMVVAVLICMAIIVGRINPHWPDVFQGFLPSKHIVQNGGLYVCKLVDHNACGIALLIGEHSYRYRRRDCHATLALPWISFVGPGSPVD
jgi:metal iron transporter